MSLIQDVLLNATFLIIGVIVTPYINKIWLKFSRTYQEKENQKKIIFNNTVKFVIDNPHEETVLRIRFLQRGIVPLILIIMGIIFLASNNFILSILAFLINIAVIYQIYSLRKLGNIIDEVNKHKLKSNPNIDLDIKLPKEGVGVEFPIRKTSKKRKTL